MTPITRTIREQITQKIRDDLVAGVFEDGQALREAQLAERFGVSRGPIRDAFLQLTHEGFLVYEANRGVTVRQAPDGENWRFIISLRRQIECFAMQQGLSQVTKEDLKRIHSVLNELRVACEQGDVAAVARCDMAFHQTCIEAVGGDDFLPIWKWLCSQMVLAYSRMDDYMQVYAEHVAIHEAFVVGDLEMVCGKIKENIR